MENQKVSETVLVTGGSGFIAGYCIIELLKRGYKVKASLRSLNRVADVKQDCSDLTQDLPAYQKSKTLSEKAAWDFIAGEGKGLELAVVNPVGVLGPVLGADYSHSIQTIHQMLKGTLKGVPKISFHTTPGRWLIKKRLERAHYQIVVQKQRPVDVYIDAGFENLAHFSFAFKKLFGYNVSQVNQVNSNDLSKG